MASLPFEQTLSALRREETVVVRTIAAIALAMLCLWLIVGIRTALPRTLASNDGAIVSAGAQMRILSSSDDTLVRLPVVLGQRVDKGEVLAQFDTQLLQLDLQSTRRQAEQQQQQLNLVAQQLQSLVQQRIDEERTAVGEFQQLQSRQRQAQSKIDYASKAAALYSELRSERRIDRLQYEEAAATLAQEQLELAAVTAMLAQAESQRDLTAAQLASQRAALLERQALLAQQATDIARRVDQLVAKIAEATLTAPSAAVVGALADVAAGSVVPKDEWLLTLIPQRGPQFRATFAARDAGGQVQVGQPARIELFALPWVEYGTVQAQVLQVGQVATDGYLDVVFELSADDPLRPRLEQGLRGRVRVEVGAMTLAQRFMRLLSLGPAV